MGVNLIFFFLTNIVTCALIVTTTFQPISATLALAFAFVNASFIFLAMNFEFIALIFLIVYVGAIIILFLFSILLLHLKHERSIESYSDINYKASICFFIINYIVLIFYFFISESLFLEETFLYKTDEYFLKNASWDYLELKNITDSHEMFVNRFFAGFNKLEFSKVFGYKFKKNGLNYVWNYYTHPSGDYVTMDVTKKVVRSFNLIEIENKLNHICSNLAKKIENFKILENHFTVNLTVKTLKPDVFYGDFNLKEFLVHEFFIFGKYSLLDLGTVPVYGLRELPAEYTFFNLQGRSGDPFFLIHDYETLKNHIIHNDSIILNTLFIDWELDFNTISEKTFSESFLASELEAIGLVLYTQGCIYFILVSILLLVALIGSVVLINTNSKGLIESQNTANQMSKKPNILFFN